MRNVFQRLAAVGLLCAWATVAVAAPAPAAAETAPATITVTGQTGRSASLMLTRPVTVQDLLDPGAFLATAPEGGFVALALESVREHRFVATIARIHDSANTLFVGYDQTLTLPAGRYRAHLLGSAGTATVTLMGTSVGGQQNSVRSRRPSGVTSSLDDLTVGPAAGGTRTTTLDLQPGDLNLTAYCQQATASPTGFIDISFYPGGPTTDPNTSLPISGGPFPYLTTITDVEVCYFTGIGLNADAEAERQVRSEVRVGSTAVMPRFSQVLAITS